MSLLLNALKKAAEENSDTLNDASAKDEELLDLDIEEELLELNFDEAPELVEELEAGIPIEETDSKSPAVHVVEEIDDVEKIVEPNNVTEPLPENEPVYERSELAKQIFASKPESKKSHLKWLLILLLLFFLSGVGLCVYDLFVQPEPVSRMAQFEVTELKKAEKTVVPVAKELVKKPVVYKPVKLPQKTQAKSVPRKPKKKISIVRNKQRDTLLENLQLGFKEYQQGNYAASTIAYKRAVQQDVKNRDALLGLAANNIRQAQSDDKYLPKAKDLYLTLLELDPNDAAAQAGLAAVDKRFMQASSLAALKEAVQQRPHLAPLHYSLANKYAAQQNWSQAQSAYFNAFSLAPDHTDYAFNLAVSLDKIGQSEAALKYYQQALSLSSYRPHAIDIPALERRMQYLKGGD